MRILLGIAKRMVLAVHNSIRARVEVRRTLANKCQYVETTLVKLVGGKHLMRGIPVQEKCLKKQGQEPVADKKY